MGECPNCSRRFDHKNAAERLHGQNRCNDAGGWCLTAHRMIKMLPNLLFPEFHIGHPPFLL